jgi:succinoglycan biosynthesis transport protein ExoP
MDNELDERSSLESILEYAQLFWHWAWLLVLAAMIAGGAAYYLTNRQPRVYQSTSLVMVNSASGSQYDTSSSIYVGVQQASAYVKTMTTKPIIDAVSKKLGFIVDSKNIQVQQVATTQLINVTVTDMDPQRAADIANTLVAVFADQVLADQTSRYADLKTNLETELADLNALIASVNAQLIQLSIKSTPASPGSPTPTVSPADIQTKAELQTTLSQYQQNRSYLVTSYQQYQLSEAQSTSTIIQKDPAVANPIPVQPQPIRSALLAAVVGFMIAAGIIFLITFLEDTISDPEEITRHWGIPVLGLITSYNTEQNPIITMSQPRSPVSEAYRSLRTNLQFAGVNAPLRTVLVTSPSPSDGKTSVVANLAAVIAQNEKEVMTIDADLRRPRLHKVFQLTNRIGLSDYFIRPQDRLNGVVKTTNLKGLCVITSGSLPPNPSELLGSEKMTEVITLLSQQFNMILFDSPPLLMVTDALVLAPRVDGVILVINPKITKRGALKHSIEQLKMVNANLLGVVLNNVKVERSQYYYNRNYYYGKQYGRSGDEPIEKKDANSIDK